MRFESIKFPESPGVYIMKSAGGAVLYIGKAINLRKRIKSYFGREAKERYQIKFLMERVASIETIECRTEKEALLLEHKLIKEFKPKYNIDAKDDKTFYRIKVTTSHSFPAVYLTRHVRKDGNSYFGPYISSLAARELLDHIVRFFKIRNCGDREFLNRSRPCIQYDIGRCTAPCVGLVAKEAYMAQVHGALLLLNGRKAELIKELKERMKSASEGTRFEEAAFYRDLIKETRRLFEKQNVVRPDEEFARNISVADEVYLPLGRELARRLKLKGPLNLIECVDVSNISGKNPCGAVACFMNGQPAKNRYRLFNIQGPEEPNDYAMMYEVLARRFARSDWEFPDLLLVDGGRGQLAVAQKVIEELKLSVPVVAVAKIESSHRKGSDNAQVFLPNRTNPLKFKKGDKSLLFLIRIRDEAHRFVIGHFRRRHSRNISSGDI